jgi:3-methylfumaryl-CoA hydratase
MFNAHRIHYDRDYATGVEGYPGLVVQGPFMATLMFRLATDIHCRRPDRFVYRGETPLFDTEPFAVHARQDGEGLELWTARRGGPVAMRSSAHWR